jgi:Tfp pilus assembly protein PilE
MKRNLFIAVLVTTSIVIAIMGILIVVGVTGWKAAVRSTNEAAAVKTLTTIAEQQKLYYNSRRSSFGTFDEMLAGNLLDTRFAGTTPVVDGYVYNMRVTPKSSTLPAGFAVNADPLATEGFGATGKNHFYLDSDSNTVHVSSTQPATAADPQIGQ